MKRRSVAPSADDGSPAQRPRIENESDDSDSKAGTWTETSEMLFFRSEGSKLLPKFAGFDMDGTLITTKSGKRFPVGPDDWVLWSQTVPVKLRALVNESPPYCIALLTNQAAIERAPGGGKPAFKRKIEFVVKALGVPAVVLIAIDPDGCSLFRKPCTGGLDFLANIGMRENGKSDAKDGFWDMKNSFYVGDAAGRVAGWKAGVKADFACSDRLFAMNAGLQFHTPEEFFLKNSPAPFKLPDFNPMKSELGPPTTSTILATVKELVIYCGPPACGKSSFSKKFLSSGRYDIYSRDQLGTWQKVAQAAETALSAGRSVVIDNTNPDVESRARYLEIAKGLKIPARCFVFDISLEQARHNERFRRLAHKLKPPTNKNEKPHTNVPDMVFHMFKKNFKEPSKDEGFTEIVRVKFVPEFTDPVLEKLYCSYLIDK